MFVQVVVYKARQREISVLNRLVALNAQKVRKGKVELKQMCRKVLDSGHIDAEGDTKRADERSN